MLEFLRKRAEQAAVVMSGSAPLAKAGVLDGRATRNRRFVDLARAQGPKVRWVPEGRWVEDGPMATASGVAAGTGMALAVVARLYGRGAAEQIAALTEYEWQSDPARDPFAKYLNQGKLAPEF